MSRYRPYPAYKDSGVEWLGEVPEHWDVMPLKRRVKLLTEKTSRRDFPVALENIESWSGRFLETESKFEGEGVLFQTGDILFGKLRPYLAKVYLAEVSGEAVGDFHVLRPAESINSRFVQYQILNRDFISIADSSTFGAKMPRVGWEFMGNMEFLVPPIAEQSAISTFLDRETAKLDTLITKQEKLIDLLQEKRQALISYAVTKGLNPDASIKDSGVDWLGEVPAHWEIKRLKHLSPQITVGIVVEPSKYYVFEGIPALRSLNIFPGRIKLENVVYISPESNLQLSKSMLRKGDLVAVRSGQPGTTAVVPFEMDGFNCIDLIIIRASIKVTSSYLCWFMNSDGSQYQFNEGAGGAIQQHFNIGMAMNIVVPCPPIDEQLVIADSLDLETSKLDTLIEKSRRFIELLREHRTALISAAVTGKIDVRQVA